jgi:hypothetical protein
MLAERNRLYGLARDKATAAQEVLKTLPEEIREGKVLIMDDGHPYNRLISGKYSGEADLLHMLEPLRRLYVAVNKIRDYKPPERDTPEVEQARQAEQKLRRKMSLPSSLFAPRFLRLAL